MTVRRASIWIAVIGVLLFGMYLANSFFSKSGSGFLIADRGFGAADLKLKKVLLKVAGSDFNADVTLRHEGEDLVIDLTNFNVVIESERYRDTDKEFSLADAGGERYDPPIPLIKYGMHVGDTWAWSGNLSIGGIGHKATARVSSSVDTVPVEGALAHDVVRIDVDRSVDSGVPGRPSLVQKLSFWIGRNMGVIKRQYGEYSSSREPLEK